MTSFENKIVVNGKEYKDISEVPEEFKVIFKDENKNGIPDMLEGILGSFDPKNTKNTDIQFTNLFYDGKSYKSSSELPANAREILEKGLASLDKSGMKISPGVYNTASGTTSSTSSVPGFSGTSRTNDLVPQNLRNEVSDLNPGFKFRVVMTIIFFILAVVFIYWLLKML